ncbi:MAG: metallophosphoesterase family protein [Candidatus Omnitrophica bacterium]|nr:metallophosphoesterase family protein [Candidatus Omnitrophota bacterium]
MRIAVFADVHGNMYAFEKILEALKKERADLHIFCGDICGYYYQQDEVIQALRQMRNLVSVVGNHDEIFLRMLEDTRLEEEYTKQYGRSCSLFKESAALESVTFLKELPKKYIIEEYAVAVFHGSPWDYCNEYVYPDGALDRFRELPYRFVLLGHTHYPMDRIAGGVRIINPGSCGQPRDMHIPSYAVLDIDSGEVISRRVPYNTEYLKNDVRRYKEDNLYLEEILTRGEGCYEQANCTSHRNRRGYRPERT